MVLKPKGFRMEPSCSTNVTAMENKKGGVTRHTHLLQVQFFWNCVSPACSRRLIVAESAAAVKCNMDMERVADACRWKAAASYAVKQLTSVLTVCIINIHQVIKRENFLIQKNDDE